VKSKCKCTALLYFRSCSLQLFVPYAVSEQFFKSSVSVSQLAVTAQRKSQTTFSMHVAKYVAVGENE
jgi:hypothetical protein